MDRPEGNATSGHDSCGVRFTSEAWGSVSVGFGGGRQLSPLFWEWGALSTHPPPNIESPPTPALYAPPTSVQAVQRYYQIGVLLHTYPPEGRGKGHAVRLAERFRSEDAMHELIARVHAFRRTTDMSLDNVIEAVKNMP